MVGHVEDIAVLADMQGKQFGTRIIQALDYIAATVGCYKAILDCHERNEGFYAKCGYQKAGIQMVRSFFFFSFLSFPFPPRSFYFLSVLTPSW